MKDKIISFLFTGIMIILVFFVGMDTRKLGDPTEAYQVYLNGKKIGLISSKKTLLDMIDNEQTMIKESYGVEKVYPPNGLSINKVYTYNHDIVSEDQIYNEVKEQESFTIEGYTVTITYNENSSSTILDKGLKELKIYTLDKEIVKKALYNTAIAFIGEDQLESYESKTQSEIVDEGEKLTSVYYAESITIKKDYISSKEKIFTDVDELSMYLLYGTTEKQKTVNVKATDDLETIADNNNLNILELLVANPNITRDTLLIEGQEINIGLINPVVSVTYGKKVIETVEIAFNTTYVDDDTKYASYQETTTEGQNGKTKITQDIIYVNGDIKSLVISNKEVITPVIDKVITRGTRGYSGGYWGYGNEYGTDAYYWPTATPFIITSTFKWRWGKHHNGIDVSGAGFGSPIYSSTSGTVIEVNNGCPSRGYYGSSCGSGYGNHIKIQAPNGYIIYYAHLTNQMMVSVGQTVSQGQLISYMGNSGSSTGTHLHFQINDTNGQALDPCKEAFRCP